MRKAIIGGALVLTIGLALTGCASATASHTTTAKVTTTHTKAPSVNISELKAGDAVDDSTAAAINAKGGSTVAYKLPNGTYVVIKKDSPLPPAVQANVNSIANAAPNSTGQNDSGANVNTAHGLQSSIGFSTGKSVAVLQYGSHTEASGAVVIGWIGIASFYNGQNLAPISTSEATVRADLEAEIAKQSDPASWIIVANQ
jgi:hypothetical protein